MPLSESVARREVHHRVIDMRTYARDDGLYDVEARLVDRKPFDYKRPSCPEPVPAGSPLHDLWIRVTLDETYVVRAIESSSDVTPWGVCKAAGSPLQGLVGQQVARGWSNRVKELLRGAAGCTHLMEMLVTLGTPALQGIRGLRRDQVNEPGHDRLPAKLDSCYAYGRGRDVVRMLWPDHYRPGPSS